MHWYKVHFDAERLSDGKSIEFLRAFRECNINANFPHGLALFHLQGESMNSSTYFLPPSANNLCPELVRDFNGVLVDRPDRRELAITVGSPDVLDFWYRGGSN